MREMEIGNRRGERRRKKEKDEGKGERGEMEGDEARKRRM
jgi:hypothetical protein